MVGNFWTPTISPKWVKTKVSRRLMMVRILDQYWMLLDPESLASIFDRQLRFFSRLCSSKTLVSITTSDSRMTTTLRSGLVVETDLTYTWRYWGILGLESSQRRDVIRGSNERPRGGGGGAGGGGDSAVQQ